jgi:hypothetical protein
VSRTRFPVADKAGGFVLRRPSELAPFFGSYAILGFGSGFSFLDKEAFPGMISLDFSLREKASR